MIKWLINITTPIRSENYHIPDCVVRAIKTATKIPYYDVVKLLHNNGKIFRCDDLSVRCYEYLLDYDLGLPHYKGNNKTVEEIANDFPNNTLLIRIKGHLTTSLNGVILDIWDCSYEKVTDFWIVE